jgi:MGT family glycosyltransferase
MTGVVAALPEYAKGLRESRAQYDGRLRALQHEAGLEAAEWPLLSPHLVLVFSTPALLGQASSFPSHYRLVGPALGPRLERASFPWHELRDGPRVLVSLGTISGARGGRFFAAVVEALGATDVQVVLVAPPELVPAAPDNVIVAPEVPQLGLLPHVNAVVSHGGHNTISEALAEGLPLVLAPIHDDQPILARQVATAGAGIRLRFDRATPREIRAAVEKVLREPAYREAAVRIRASFEEAGGARAAAEALEALAA